MLWLWHRLAAAALIRLLVWEPPYAMSAAPERQKKKKEREKEKIVALWKKKVGERRDRGVRNPIEFFFFFFF